MDNLKQNETQKTKPIPLETNISPTKWYRNFQISKAMLFFLIGIAVGAVLMELYDIKRDQQPINNQSEVAKQAPSTPEQTGKSKITAEDLAKYVEAKDCTELAQFNDLTIPITRHRMQSIDLENSLITVARDSGTIYTRWKTLPLVVDNQCKEISLTDIESGDTLNIYTAKNGEDTSFSSDVKMIQKVN